MTGTWRLVAIRRRLVIFFINLLKTAVFHPDSCAAGEAGHERITKKLCGKVACPMSGKMVRSKKYGTLWRVRWKSGKPG